jgi:hypothetical protein
MRNKLYTLLAIACFFGYMWLGFTIFADQFSKEIPFRICIIKNLTNYPCPSCGTTRAVKMLLYGQWKQSILMNPFGIVVALLMFMLPIWLLFDVMYKKQTLLNAYHKTEELIKIRWIAFLLILLVLLNWIWTIYNEI